MTVNDSRSFNLVSRLANVVANLPIRFKLTLGAAMIAFLVALLLTLVSSLTAAQALTQAIGLNLQSRAEAEGQHLGDALAEQINLARSLALNPVINQYVILENSTYTGDDDSIRQQLRELDAQWATLDENSLQVQAIYRTPPTAEMNRFANKFGAIIRIEVTDHYGAVVGTIVGAGGGKPLHYYAGDQVWWQAAYNNGLGGTWVSQPFTDIASNQRAIAIATPIVDPPSGRFDGVIYALYRFTPIEELVAQIQSGVQAQQAGKGNATLVNQEAAVITDPSGRYNQIDESLRERVAALESSWVSGRIGGSNLVVGLAPVRSENWSAINDLEWMIVIHQEQSEALSPVTSIIQLGIATLVISLLIIIIASAYATNLLILPLRQLAQAAQRVSAGHLDVTVPAHSRDELGTLGQAFNEMTTRLQQSYTDLEQQVAARTAQLQASADVARAVTSVLEPSQLLRQMINLITDRFGFYYAAVFTLDEMGEFAVLREATGQAGQTLKERGHKLQVDGQSMVGAAINKRQARIALDVGQEAVRFDNPLLPHTRSEIALPLVVGDRVIGALDVQSTQAAAFDQASAAVLQSMADQVAVALENARLFQQAQASLKELELANRLLSQQGWQAFLGTQPASFAEFHSANMQPLTPETIAETLPQSNIIRVPLQVRGQTIGSLLVEPASQQVGQPSLDAELLAAIADQAAQAMESARLFEQSQRLATQEQLVSQATARMRESLDLDIVLRTALDEIYAALGLEELAIHLAIEETAPELKGQVV